MEAKLLAQRSSIDLELSLDSQEEMVPNCWLLKWTKLDQPRL